MRERDKVKFAQIEQKLLPMPPHSLPYTNSLRNVDTKVQAIFTELSGQARQLELTLVPIHTGCNRFYDTLERWLEFRAGVCGPLLQVCPSLFVLFHEKSLLNERKMRSCVEYVRFHFALFITEHFASNTSNFTLRCLLQSAFSVLRRMFELFRVCYHFSDLTMCI